MKKYNNLRQIIEIWAVSIVYVINLGIKIIDKGISKMYTTVNGAILTFIVISVVLLAIVFTINKKFRLKTIPKLKIFTSNITNLMFLIVILISVNFYGEEIAYWIGIIVGLIWCLIAIIFITGKKKGE